MSYNQDSDGSFDMVPEDHTEGSFDSGPDLLSGGAGPARRRSSVKRKERRKSKSKRKERTTSLNGSASKLGQDDDEFSKMISPTSSASTRVFDYGDAYVVKTNQPRPEERNALLEMPSDNLDPNDPLAANNLMEEFEDELNDESSGRDERRRNLAAFSDTSSKKASPMKRHLSKVKSNAIPILFCVLFLMGLIAIILYVVGFAKSNNNTSNKTAQVVPAAPETLSLMCSVSRAGGTAAAVAVPELCQDACMEAECCWNPKGNFVCTSDTLKQCPSYQKECTPWKEKLAGVKDGMVVPPLPAGLQTECAKKFDTDDVSDECRYGCYQAGCCWDKKTAITCNPDSVQHCLDYKEVCSFLNTHVQPPPESNGPNTWPFPDAPDGLAVYCDPSEMEEVSLHICEDKCSKAECCWKTGVSSCISTYPHEACHDYTQACGILNQLATAPDNSHDITSETPPPATGTSTTNNLPEAPSGLAYICSKDSIADSEGGGDALLACEQQCLQASCCWQPNAVSPCPDNDRCEGYAQPCSIFTSLFDKPDDYDSTAETLEPVTVSKVPTAPEDISSTCSKDVLTTSVDNGKFIVECEKACLMGACCWKENHPTQCPDAQECAAYKEPCGTNLIGALVALETGSSNAKPATPAPVTPAPAPTPPTKPVETNVPEAPSNLSMMCNPDVLKLTVSNGDFIVQCEEECLEAACCWKENHATVCPDAPQCDEYLVPCGEHLAPVLTEMENADNPNAGSSSAGGSTAVTPTRPPAPDDMNLRCSVANLNTNPDGRGFCEESCNPVECCWKDAKDCASDPVCTEYKLCENLLTTTPLGNNNGNAPPAPPEDLQDNCSAGSVLTMNGLEKCKTACAAADCCWLGESDALTCKTAVECRTYETECELLRNMLQETNNSNGGGGRRMLRHG